MVSMNKAEVDFREQPAVSALGGVRRQLRLGKSMKLRHRSLVEAVFKKNDSIFEYPLRLCWRTLSQTELSANFRNDVPDLIAPLQFMITVPKKKRRRAVDRVAMRRKVREAFRLNRVALEECVALHDDIRTLSLAFVYVGEKNHDWEKIERKMKILLEKLIVKLNDSPIL